MSQEFLNSSDIISIFYKMRGKRVSESMTTGLFGYSGIFCGFSYRFLDGGFMDMMPTLFTSIEVSKSFGCRKYILPIPFFLSLSCPHSINPPQHVTVRYIACDIARILIRYCGYISLKI
jgi:hypothetical protein